MQEIGMAVIPIYSPQKTKFRQKTLKSGFCLKIYPHAVVIACVLLRITKVAAFSQFTTNQTENPSDLEPFGQLNKLEPKYPCNSDKCLHAAQEIVNGMDTSVDPCDNFYDFACSGWIQRNIIPPYMASWSVFHKLQQKMRKLSIDILSQPKSSSEPQPVQMAKDHYQACMKSRTYDDIHKQNESLQFIWDKLEKYGGWPMLYENGTWDSSRFSWRNSVVNLKREFGSTELIDVTTIQSRDGNVSANSIVLRPPSFGGGSVENVPDEPDSGSESMKNGSVYKTFIMNVTKELLAFKGREINETYISSVAGQIIYVELLFKDLEKSSTQTQKRFTVETLQAYLDVLRLFYRPNAGISVLGLLNLFYLHDKTTPLILENQLLTVVSPDYLSSLLDTVAWVKPEALANYLHFKLLVKLLHLSNVKTFHEYENTANMHALGTNEPWPSEQRCAKKVEQAFPMGLGFALLEKIGLTKYDSQSDSYGSAKNFTKLEQMFQNIKAEYEHLLLKSWNPTYMDVGLLLYLLDITKLCAGYPHWIFSRERLESEYDDLNFTFDNSMKSLDYMEQSIAINSIKFVKQLQTLSKPRDSDSCQWLRFPGTVGAFSKSFTVYLPVAMLQEPFYDEHLPKFLNYGKIGTILGHEITHGLYGPGWSEYVNGSLTPPATCLVNQYERFYNPLVNSSLNGHLTLEENFCDNAGLDTAFRAYRRSSRWDDPHNLKGLEKYTNDQLFFLGFAQNFCETSTAAGLSSILEEDIHSPGPVRILASLKNSYDFAQAWNCPAGSNMNPRFRSDEACAIFESSENSLRRSLN